MLGQVIWQVLNQRLKQTRGQWAILLTWATIDIMKSDLWSLKQNMWKMSHTRFCIILYTWIINIKFRIACEAQEFTGAKVCIYVQPYIITFEFLWIISMFSFVKLEPLPPCWYVLIHNQVYFFLFGDTCITKAQTERLKNNGFELCVLEILVNKQ